MWKATLFFALCAACSATDDTAASSADALDAQTMYQRPAMARVWQNDVRTAGDMTAAQIADRIHHMSDIGGPNTPSVISGTIRVSRDQVIDWNMIGDWLSLRDAFPGVPFDIVLNICDYERADPQATNPGNVITKMRAINDEMAAWEKAFPGHHYRPNAWFFDFYDRPFSNNADCKPVQAPAVMFAALSKWAHANNQLVGGNVWDTVPPGADFVAVPDEEGIQHTLSKLQSMKNVMRLAHIENNPQKCDYDTPWNPSSEQCKGSNGDRLIWRTTPQARLWYHKQYYNAQTPTLRYMTPVLFPISHHLGASGPHAFDAVTNAPASSLPRH